jgi:hypothetical protein
MRRGLCDFLTTMYFSRAQNFVIIRNVNPSAVISLNIKCI